MSIASSISSLTTRIAQEFQAVRAEMDAIGGGGGGGGGGWTLLVQQNVNAASLVNFNYGADVRTAILGQYSELLFIHRLISQSFSGLYLTAPLIADTPTAWEISAVGTGGQNGFISYNTTVGANILRLQNGSSGMASTIYLYGR